MIKEKKFGSMDITNKSVVDNLYDNSKPKTKRTKLTGHDTRDIQSDRLAYNNSIRHSCKIDRGKIDSPAPGYKRISDFMSSSRADPGGGVQLTKYSGKKSEGPSSAFVASEVAQPPF